jgi:hypothetical protein
MACWRIVLLLSANSTNPAGGKDAPQHTRVAGQSRNGDADMVVNVDQLLLVRRELAGAALEGEEHGVGRGTEPDGRTALLDGLERVLDLVQLALGRLG